MHSQFFAVSRLVITIFCGLLYFSMMGVHPVCVFTVLYILVILHQILQQNVIPKERGSLDVADSATRTMSRLDAICNHRIKPFLKRQLF
jgi:hypothetical protein